MKIRSWRQWFNQSNKGEKRKIPPLGWMGVAVLLVLMISALTYSAVKGGLRLIGVSPSGEVELRTNLTFTFSAPVVDKEEVGVTFEGDPIRFTPAARGKFRWISRNELRFLPEEPFLPSTRYRAEIRVDLGAGGEQSLLGNRTVEFATERFRIERVDTSFAPVENDRGLRLQIRLSFNYPVAPEELMKALKISLRKTGNAIGYTLDSVEGSKYLTATSEPLFSGDEEQEIEFSIPEDFHCLRGELGLEKKLASTVTLGARKPLTIVNATIKGEQNKFLIAVKCSEPVEAETAAGFVRLTPEVDLRVEVDNEFIILKSDRFKAGEKYNLRISSGLPAVNGYPLARDYAATLQVRDMEPGLSFNSPGRYLSSKGSQNLGLETVNIDRANIEISQIYANNIVAFLNRIGGYRYYCYPDEVAGFGKVVKSEVITVEGAKNEMVTTPINLTSYFSGDFRGILQVVAYDNDRRWVNDYKYVVLTDLGMVGKMGQDELLVWVNSLRTMTPKDKVRVTLFSRNNQIIDSAYTDATGVARITDLRKKLEGHEPLLILAEEGEDFSFLHLESSQVSTVDFPVRGRETVAGKYEAFAYLERDIYRPGDQGHLVAIVRGPEASLPPEFPVKLRILRPDGQVFKELVGNTFDRGVCEFPVEIPEYAQTGKYHAQVLVGEEMIGAVSFLVEEFMPDRIKVTTETNKKEYTPGEKLRATVKGVNLFGPPAAGRRTEARLRLEPVEFTASLFRSYTFGDQNRKFSARTDELGEQKLDEQGMARFEYTFPRDLAPAGMIRAVIQSTVIEDGGRAVSDYEAVDLHAYERYIGLKALSERYGQVSQAYQVKYVVVDKKGAPVEEASELTVEVYRIIWNSIYRRDTDGRYRYVSEEERIKVFTDRVKEGPGEKTFAYTPEDYGRHEIVFSDPKTGAQSSLSFYVSGWGYAPWAMEDPDKIDLDLNRPSSEAYSPGEVAELQVKAPFAGKALITVEREKVFDYQIVEFKENTGVVKIPVKKEYLPNVYLSVHLIRSVESLEKHAPARAFGVIPLTVDTKGYKLGMKIETAEILRPNQEAVFRVLTERIPTGSYLTLAAVDEGICQLTDYSVPTPTEFFYGKRRLEISSHDLYGLLLPEVEGIKSASVPGGGADRLSQVRKENLNPISLRRVKPVSLWSGLVKPDQNGVATIKMKIPQFNGTLRLMAVYFGEKEFGSAEKLVIVRDPIVMTPTFPRFVAPGDRFTVPVSVFNGTGREGKFTLRLTSEGEVRSVSKPTQTLSLKDQEEKLVHLQLQAGKVPGKLRFHLEISGNGETCQIEEELSLRPSVPRSQEISSGSLTSGEPLEFSLEEKWLPGTGEYTLALAPFPAIKFAGSLLKLLEYPYGCTEQTTSKLFPLLYFDQLLSATEGGVFTGSADHYLAEGIERLEAMQLSDGSFAVWPGVRRSNAWGSIYTGHFLVEARKAGFEVTDRVYDRLLSYLQREARKSGGNEYANQNRVYALYVLSLAGKPDLSAMSYLKRYAWDQLGGYSRAQLAAAYYYTGDRVTAQELIPEKLAAWTIKNETGGNFNSNVRSDAIILSALADIDPTNPAVYKLVERLTAAARIGYWGSTQENAFALMAVGKILGGRSEGEYQGEVLVDGKRIAVFDSAKEYRLTDPRLAEGKVSVRITGGGECYYFLSSSGISTGADLPEYDRGLMARREYLDRYGKPVNPSKIREGDLLVGKITLRTLDDNLENIAVVDMLPAGLEVENPRLSTSTDISWLQERLKASAPINPEHMDIRDDRVIFFFSARKAGYYNFYYALRAVTCGEFILPSIKAECMYSPEISSYSSSGSVTVKRYSE